MLKTLNRIIYSTLERGRVVKQYLNSQTLKQNFLCSLLAVSVLALNAHMIDDTVQEIRAPYPHEMFQIISEFEIDSHQAELYHEFKEKFNSSKLKETHQDLLAQALSKVVSKVPICTFRTTTITEQTGDETDERTEVYEVVDTGFIESENEGSRIYFADMTNPFTIDGDIPADDFGKGRVLKENDSELTVRFIKNVNIPTGETSVEFMKDLPFLKDIQWAMELTIDKKDQTLKRFSSYLAKPIRKMFLFTVKTLNATYDFEYFEDCDCVGVKERRIEAAGSLIIVGRILHNSTETYSEISCKQPVQYLAPWVTSFDTFKVQF